MSELPAHLCVQKIMKRSLSRATAFGLSIAVLVLAAAAFQATPVSAVVYVIPTDESMVDRSPIIVFGEVLSVQPGPDGRSPTTDYLFGVEEVLKGFVAGSGIMIRQPGGVATDGMVMSVMGLPMLTEGDRVLLFLRREESGAHQIVEYSLGMFWEVDAGGSVQLLRESSLQAAATALGDASAVESVGTNLPRDAARFRDWIADRAAGFERSADYFETEPATGPVAVQSPYRLIRTGANCLHDLMPLRWQDFDLGNSLAMTVASGGQVGVQGGGAAELQAAMMAWNGDAESHVSLTIAGSGTPTEANTRSDSGQYWILFEDPFDTIGGSFDRDRGGILAVTRTWWRCGGQVPPHETLGDPPVEALQIQYTQLITQDGYGEDWVALNENPAKAHEEIMAHELGHVLGIGHSCGFGHYPCPDEGEIPEAIMRAYPHGDGRGARLNGDDLAALRYLYPIGDGTDDHGDTFADATSISVPSTTSGTLERDGDYDYFRLEVRTATTLTVETTGSTDTVGRLYDSNGTPLVAENDDGAGYPNFRIERQVAAGTYYVRVRGFGNRTTGAYELRVTGGDDHCDTFSCATPISVPSTTSGRLERNGDYDYFRLEVRMATTLTLETTGNTDTVGRLYDSNRAPLVGEDDDGGSGVNFRIERQVAAGTYYVRVRGFANRTTGGYELRVTGGGGGDDHCDTLSCATPISVPSTTSGRLELDGDYDYFRLEVRAATTLTVETTGSTDTVGRLYDSNRAALETNNDGGTDANFRIERQVAAGTYYVRVRGFANRTTGAYELRVAAGGGGDGTSFDLDPSNTRPHGIAYDGNRFYVQDDGEVYVYDTNGNRVPSADFELDPNNSAAQGITYALGRLYVADFRSGTIYAYDTDGDRLTSADVPLPRGVHPRGVTYGGGRFFVVAYPKVYELDASGELVGDFDLLSSPTASHFGIAHGRGRLYVVHYGDARVYAYDESGNRVPSGDFDLDSRNGYASGITYVDGRLYVVDAGSWRVYVYNDRAPRSADFDLDPENGQPSGVAIDADRVYVVDYADDRVYAYDRGSGNRVPSADFDLPMASRGYSGIAYANGHFFALTLLDGDVLAFDRTGIRVPSRDFHLGGSVQGGSSGITYAQGHLYVLDDHDNQVQAYDNNGNRVRSADFDLDAANTHASGITYAEDRFFVVDFTDDRVYAYDSDGHRAPWAEFVLDSENSSATGIEYVDGRFYVVDSDSDGVYVYESVQAEAAGDFVLDPENSSPSGIVYAEGRFYVADSADEYVYAYDRAGNRVPSRDFHVGGIPTAGITYAEGLLYVTHGGSARRVWAFTLSGAPVRSAYITLDPANTNPHGITSAQGRLYVVDDADDKVFAYERTGNRAPLWDFDLDSQCELPKGVAYVSGPTVPRSWPPFYVVDSNSDKAYAHDSIGSRQSWADFHLDPENRRPAGMTFAEGRIYVVDLRENKVYAYEHDGDRVP